MRSGNLDLSCWVVSLKQYLKFLSCASILAWVTIWVTKRSFSSTTANILLRSASERFWETFSLFLFLFWVFFGLNCSPVGSNITVFWYLNSDRSS